MMWRPRSIISQAFALVFVSVAATLGLGFGVLALSPPPPPATISIDAYIDAYRGDDTTHVALMPLRNAPADWNQPKGQAELLIANSLAGGLGVPPTAVKVTMAIPTPFGLEPRPAGSQPGQLTVIDVPEALRFSPAGRPTDIGQLLRSPAMRVPPFIVAVRRPEGGFVLLSPHEPFPTAWQLRLLTIFGLALAVVGPLAWIGTRRWTQAVRDLAARVDAFDGTIVGARVTRPGDAQEVRGLEAAFDALHRRVKSQSDERTQMLMAVAHDLRTPLTSMRIRSEAVDETLRSGFVRDVARMDKMISGVLDYARLPSPADSHETVDLARLVSDVVTEAKLRGQQLTAAVELAFVKGSAVDLLRMIDNLLNNAARYAKSAHISLTVDDERVELTVIDDGPGVPDGALAKLTDPFFRVEPSRSRTTGGVGLGLATVDAIVARHGGSIRFSNLAQGFKAVVNLPRYKPNLAAPPSVHLSTALPMNL